MIELNEISKSYPKGVHALENVSFNIEKGSFVSIIGPSGAGKTTILRLINGSEKPDSGAVFIEKKRFDTEKGRARKLVQRKTATIYQDFCLVEETTALQNVLNAGLAEMSFFRVLTGNFSNEQKNRAKKALEASGLQDKIDASVSDLSGGQKQRVAVAKALMQNASLILADEPVASLDPVTAESVIRLLKSLQTEKNMTVLMNSHNVELALKYSDKVLGLKDGKLQFFCKPSEITSQMLSELYGKSSETKESEG